MPEDVLVSDLIRIVAAIVIAGVVLWGLDNLPMDEALRRVARVVTIVVVVVVVVLWLVRILERA
jgi:hypothetical protein